MKKEAREDKCLLSFIFRIKHDLKSCSSICSNVKIWKLNIIKKLFHVLRFQNIPTKNQKTCHTFRGIHMNSSDENKRIKKLLSGTHWHYIDKIRATWKRKSTLKSKLTANLQNSNRLLTMIKNYGLICM